MALLSTRARLRRLPSRVGSLSRVTWLLLSFLLLPLLLLLTLVLVLTLQPLKQLLLGSHVCCFLLLLLALSLPLLLQQLLVAARNPFPGHANRRGHAVCITQVDRICMLAQLQEEGACALWYRHLHN
jgi:hypothetical protein